MTLILQVIIPNRVPGVSHFSRSTGWFPLLFRLEMMQPVVLLDLNQKISLIIIQGINSKLGKLTKCRLDRSRGDSDGITALVHCWKCLSA